MHACTQTLIYQSKRTNPKSQILYIIFFPLTDLRRSSNSDRRTPSRYMKLLSFTYIYTQPPPFLPPSLFLGKGREVVFKFQATVVTG